MKRQSRQALTDWLVAEIELPIHGLPFQEMTGRVISSGAISRRLFCLFILNLISFLLLEKPKKKLKRRHTSGSEPTQRKQSDAFSFLAEKKYFFRKVLEKLPNQFMSLFPQSKFVAAKANTEVKRIFLDG